MALYQQFMVKLEMVDPIDVALQTSINPWCL